MASLTVEREKIVERTVRGKKQRARSGRLPQATGKGCYGYTYVPDTGRRDLNPVQAPIVVRIFEQFVAGKGCSRIAEDLNADGVPTFTGKHWSPITVYRTLRRETYTGITIYRKTGTKMVKRPGRKHRVREVFDRPESEHIEIPGASPQIVPREIFSRAQALLDDPARRTQRAPSRNYPLSGRIRCRGCGAGMVGHATNRGRYFYYRCNRVYLSKPRTSAASPARFAPTRSSPPCAKSSRSCWPTPRWCSRWPRPCGSTPKAARVLAEVERELGEAAERGSSRLVDLYMDGSIARALLDEKRAALAARRTGLEREQARRLAEAEPGCDPEMLRERMPEALAFIEEWVQRADGDKLQLLLEAFRVSIKATREEAEIRAEVPLIEGVEGRNYPTIEQTSA